MAENDFDLGVGRGSLPIIDRQFDASLTAQAGQVVEEIKRRILLGTGGRPDQYVDALLTTILINQVTLKIMFMEAMVAQGMLMRYPPEGGFDPGGNGNDR